MSSVRENKAGQTATEVACMWAGARSLDHLGRTSEVKIQKSCKSKV